MGRQLDDGLLVSPAAHGERREAEAGVVSASTSSRDPHADDQLLATVELLFFAYRDFISDPDQMLRDMGFGRAHHRVLHFVHRYPGLRVADVLQILKITKQSLSRVLRDLVTAGHVAQRTGASDRRERLLFATRKGSDLARRLAQPQIERIAATLSALATAHPDAAPHDHRDSAQKFLYHMITATERTAVAALMARRPSPSPSPSLVPLPLPAPVTGRSEPAGCSGREQACEPPSRRLAQPLLTGTAGDAKTSRTTPGASTETTNAVTSDTISKRRRMAQQRSSQARKGSRRP